MTNQSVKLYNAVTFQMVSDLRLYVVELDLGTIILEASLVLYGGTFTSNSS